MIEESVRTPLSVAFEAALALALCLPPMGAINPDVSLTYLIKAPHGGELFKSR